VRFIEDSAEFGRGSLGLHGVAGFGEVFPTSELAGEVRLSLDMHIDGPLGDEAPQRSEISILPGVIRRQVEFPGESRQRGRGDLRQRLTQGRPWREAGARVADQRRRLS
jgi:hypothetical protein